MKPFRLLLTLAWALAALCMLPAARAEMTIEIVGGGANRHPIAVAAFQDEASRVGGNLTPIVRSDLDMTGFFRQISPSAVPMAPADPASPPLPAWQAAGAQSLALGRVEDAGNGQVRISFRLFDTAQRKQLTGGTFTVPVAQTRDVAHTIADMIYQALTGHRGLFNTRIAYVLKSGREYLLQVSDVDGARPQTILRSREPIISPSWSPDGRRLAYVSFESRKPVVWVQDLATGQRRAVANFKGSNSAPAWSPDGTRLAVVLTTSGNSQVYVIDAAGGQARRVTRSDAIDTEPTWTPDGNTLLFVSDRSGTPQIYSAPAGGGEARRLTWEGSYNVSPKVSPDGRSFTYVRREGGRFRVIVQDFGSSDSRTISDAAYNERPSFAPNGRMVLYASDEGGRSVLYAANPDGSSRVRLAVINGDVQDPAWGPFNQP
ncbi:tol-pal system beta propeller repeat protein TolB [Gulbenkiania indica]|uniref:Tol-Pal system protein TolB n=1 Tax=Gulbenkiania indica TaxID=375574 RepID=A0A0K6GYF2_9NEIS|nr:Tol-Pal system beta propeller repeat protein TolB [Gulbenkiania indica]CUA83639.1 tol-pal system beta propeller repeat protein TolB [Gulbenkiania indica]